MNSAENDGDGDAGGVSVRGSGGVVDVDVDVGVLDIVGIIVAGGDDEDDENKFGRNEYVNCQEQQPHKAIQMNTICCVVTDR